MRTMMRASISSRCLRGRLTRGNTVGWKYNIEGGGANDGERVAQARNQYGVDYLDSSKRGYPY